MNAKNLLLFIAGIISGAGAMYFLKPRTNASEVTSAVEPAADTIGFISSLTERSILGLVDTAVAHPNLRAHAADRAYLNLSLHKGAKVKGILHDTTEFRKYVNETFALFTKNHKPKPGYVWQIGIYPMICKERVDGAEKPRISFYLIPTMVKYKADVVEDIIDYMVAINDSELKKHYEHIAKINGDKYIFDEGQLWP